MTCVNFVAQLPLAGTAAQRYSYILDFFYFFVRPLFLVVANGAKFLVCFLHTYPIKMILILKTMASPVKFCSVWGCH